MNPQKTDRRVILQLRDAVVLQRLSVVLPDRVEAGSVVGRQERGAHHPRARFHRDGHVQGPIALTGHALARSDALVFEEMRALAVDGELELLAGNEELQSGNEELESVNEELITLNTEYQQKITELIVSNNDFENFLRTSDVATIFLDEALRLRRFTPAVAREIPLQEHDLGRLLTEFAHPLIAAIAGDAKRIAAGGEAVMKTIETRPGVWHLVRVASRRQGTSDCGLVVTILDVSALHKTADSSGEDSISGV